MDLLGAFANATLPDAVASTENVTITDAALVNLVYGAYFGTGINAVIYRRALGDPQWDAHVCVATLSVFLGLFGGALCRSVLYTPEPPPSQAAAGEEGSDGAKNEDSRLEEGRGGGGSGRGEEGVAAHDDDEDDKHKDSGRATARVALVGSTTTAAAAAGAAAATTTTMATTAKPATGSGAAGAGAGADLWDFWPAQSAAYKAAWVLHFHFLGIWLWRWILDGFTLRRAIEQYQVGGDVSWHWGFWVGAIGGGVALSSAGMALFLHNRMKPGCRPDAEKAQWRQPEQQQ